MRTRVATLVALILVSTAALVGGSAARADDDHASTEPMLLAQETGEDPGDANVGEEEEAEQTGGEEEGTGGGASETGPPWTYQMARITLALTVLLGIGIALMYRKLVGTRQRV